MQDLLLMRHAKSDWHSGARTDFDRPLNERGLRNASDMARWMRSALPRPDIILCSPAERTRQTVLRVCAEWGLEPDRIVWEPRIYEAPPGELLTVLGETDTAARTVLMVGHNPGTELLIRELTGAEVPADEGGKAVPTGTVAHIRFDPPEAPLVRGSGQLLRVMRPRQLPG